MKFFFVIFYAALSCFTIVGTGFAETLEEAWEIGLQVNHTLKAAEQDNIASQARLDAAKGRRLPSVNIQAGYSILDNVPASLAGAAQFATADDKFFAYQVMFSLPLYTHFQISSLIDAAVAKFMAGKFAEQTARQKVKLKIAEAYLAVLGEIQQTAVAISHKQSLTAHAVDVENLYKEGMVPVNDLLAANVALANARQILLQRQNRLDIAKSVYNRLLGRPLAYAVQLESIPLLFPETALHIFSEDALKNRPELGALTERINGLQWQAKAAKAESGPQVTLKSGYDFLENSHQLHQGIWQTTVTASWNIFDGNIARNKGSALKAQSRSVIEQRRELESLILLQVRQAWLEMTESRERISVANEVLEQAATNLRVARDRYRQGLGTNTEVLDAETMRLVSYVNYDNAVNDAVLAIIRLHYAAGSL